MRSHRHEFPPHVKVARFEHAGGKCEVCLKRIATVAQYDHVVPAAVGGSPTFENCMCLCRACHAEKTTTKDVPEISRTKRISERRMGLRAPKRGGFKRPPKGYDAWTRTIRWNEQ